MGCELGGWLVFRDHDCTFVAGSLWVIQEEINAKRLAYHQWWLLFDYVRPFTSPPSQWVFLRRLHSVLWAPTVCPREAVGLQSGHVPWARNQR